MGTGRINEGIRTLAPVYFGLPMATGIIAIASHQLGYVGVARSFFLLNNVEFAVLAVLFVLRVALYLPQVRADLSSHEHGVGFLTIVAACCVLGSEYIILMESPAVARALWYAGSVAWALLSYGFFIQVTIKQRKPRLRDGIDGSWLLFVVAVQALSALAGMLATAVGAEPRMALFIGLCFHLLGWLFYLVFIGIIFFRFLFIPMRADKFRPSYWINMGAVAITTLAGLTLAAAIRQTGTWTEMAPPLEFFALFSWAAGSWWIPIVLIVGLWRHRRIPFRYNAGYWSMVFPLGMYTACTWLLWHHFNLPALQAIPQLFIMLAWVAWLLTFAGMARKVTTQFLLGR